MNRITSRFPALLLAALSLVAIPGVHADSTARIAVSEPAGNAMLGRQESFWVHIEYNTDEPINLWARSYYSRRIAHRRRYRARSDFTQSLAF